MISLNPTDRTRKEYLEERSVPVSRVEAEQELGSVRPLVPVCLIETSFFTQAALCLALSDFRLVDGINAVRKTWFLMDIEDITNDFPEYSNAIQSTRGKK